MNYYERHLGDYAKDTAHLTMIEHGAYTLLLPAAAKNVRPSMLWRPSSSSWLTAAWSTSARA